MKYKNKCLSIVMGLALCQGIFANDLVKDIEEFDINSIVYIEDETDFELGFDTADYLPEGFDPYSFYFDINNVIYVENILIEELPTKKYLPKRFDAYAYPTDVAGMNYVDPNDTIALDIDTKQYLPNGFDAFARN